MHVEDGAQAVRRVGLEVGAVSVFRGLVEVVVFGDEGFELALDVWGLLAEGIEYGDDDTHLRSCLRVARTRPMAPLPL